jgi:putative addiction module killer protein
MYRKWYSKLKDEKLKKIIRKRLMKVKEGNFGEIRPERRVSSLYIDYGPGYRLYYIRSKLTVIILLCGGDKSSQDSDVTAANDIADNLKRRLR